jgi:hypothetical protein
MGIYPTWRPHLVEVVRHRIPRASPMTSLTDTIDSPVQAPAAVAPRAHFEREKPVFAATGPARPRALRLAGQMVTGLVGLWLVALVLGALGFGHVPGFQLPRVGGDDSPSREAARHANVSAPAPVTAHDVARLARSAGAPAARALAHTRAASQRRGRHQTATGRGGSPGRGGSTGPGGSPGPGANANGNAVTQAPGGTQAPTGSAATPAPASAPAATSTSKPPASHSQAPAHSHSPHSNASPPGSSSSSPGSRSQAGAAPGRQQSAANPTPGSGRAEHAPPKG